MFYSVFVLGKKGPLARVWLAAHWDKKITKAQILETNIVESVDSILQPKIKLSLRTSSHLLLGIVRIYARKTLYLLQDCQDAAFKIKSAFRPGAVDLPDGKTEAAISAITLPEMLDFINDFDLIAEPPIQMEPPATSANIRSITLVEDISSVHVDDPLMNDMREWSDISSIHAADGTAILDKSSSTRISSKGIDAIDLFARPPLDDGFGGELGVGIVDEDDDVFRITMPTEQAIEQAQQQEVPEQQPKSVQRPDSAMSDRSDSMSYGAPASMAPSGPPSTPGSVPPPQQEDEDMPPFDELAFPQPIQPIVDGADDTLEPGREASIPKRLTETQDTLVLDVLDTPGGLEKKRKRRKKLGMLIDEVKTLSGEEMKAQLSDTTDIVTTLDLAPPSKKLMHWKKTGTSEKMFALPERQMPSKLLLVYYTRHLSTSHVDIEELLPEPELMNGDINHHERTLMEPPLPELEDLEEQLPQLSPIPDLQPPKTPKTPSYTRTPPKKKRKVEEKEKKQKEKVSPVITNHVTEEPSEVFDDPSRLSSIQGERAGSVRPSDVLPIIEPMLEDEEDDDYDYAPMSVGPPEEMLPDETDDQYEERIRQKRTNILLKFMVTRLEEDGQLWFSNLVRSNRRKQVAQKFFSLLVLKKQQAIELTQDPDEPYAEIVIEKGVRYEEALASSVL